MAQQRKKVRFDVLSQTLYGTATLAEAEQQGREIVHALNHGEHLPPDVEVTWGCVVVDDCVSMAAQKAVMDDASYIARIIWPKTFSPSEMHIPAFQAAEAAGTPLILLATQYSPQIPFATLDMSYMNNNQSAHGCPEVSSGARRAGVGITPLTGDWRDACFQMEIGAVLQSIVAGTYRPISLDEVSEEATVDLSSFQSIAAAVKEARGIRCLMIGGKMQWVTVTDCDAAQARIDHGWEVLHVGVGELAEGVAAIAGSLEGRERTAEVVRDWARRFDLSRVNADPFKWESVIDQARLYLALKDLLAEARATAFTTCFHATHGLKALPGLASQALQAEGYGFGAEGDWKQACLGRQVHLTMKALGFERPAWSFMEPYIWDLVGGRTLGSHMLEPSPAIAGSTPVVDVFELTIGRSGFPARLIFDAEPGPALDLCLLDLGDHWEVLIKPQEIVRSEPTPALPTAKSLTKPANGGNHAKLINATLVAGSSHHDVQVKDMTLEQAVAMVNAMPNTVARVLQAE
jgi:L-arabinose isomerase